MWVNRGFILTKKSVKEKHFFYLTFTDVHMGRRKVPKSDFQSHFSMSKIIRIFLIFFSLKNISLEESFLLLSFFENFNFWTTLFFKMVPNFWQSVWTSVKVKSKKYFYFTDSTPCWLTSAKLHHWGYTIEQGWCTCNLVPGFGNETSIKSKN